MKKTLSVAEAVQAAGILYELNSGREGIVSLASQAGLPCANEDEERTILREWRAFVHAAVLYGLMVHAPNIVVVEYLRATQTLLGRAGYTPAEAEAFVDDAFRAYVEPLLRTQTKECPAIFFRRVMDKEPSELPSRTVAVVAGVMAMILAAILDKLEQYEFAID